jgi:ribosomal protein S18 acetylase RimI-like enzyme
MPGEELFATIRRAVPSDMTAVGKLGALLVQTHYDFDPKRFMAATSGTARGYGSFLGTQLDEPSVIILVAERDGKVVGYTYAGVEGTDYMSLRGPAGVVYDIVVDAAHRGQGIGRALLDATLEALKSAGSPRAVLSTAEQNAPAQRLFERAGFRRTMIEMTRELDSHDHQRDDQHITKGG